MVEKKPILGELFRILISYHRNNICAPKSKNRNINQNLAGGSGSNSSRMRDVDSSKMEVES